MSTTPFDPLASPCLWCDYRGEGYWQRGTHAKGCPWFHLGGEEARREALRVVIAGTVAAAEGLAAEREKRLGAELAATRLQEALAGARQYFEAVRHCSDGEEILFEQVDSALSAPPPSLDPLRELVRAAGSLRGLTPARDAVLALYPFLREAEGEVER